MPPSPLEKAWVKSAVASNAKFLFTKTLGADPYGYKIYPKTSFACGEGNLTNRIISVGEDIILPQKEKFVIVQKIAYGKGKLLGN